MTETPAKAGVAALARLSPLHSLPAAACGLVVGQQACGERHRAGEAISTAFTESAVNQVISKRMVKRQQMRWSPKPRPTSRRRQHCTMPSLVRVS